MEIIVNSICLIILIILEIALYFVIVGRVFPSLLRVHCTVKKSQDRGVRKYIYPEGRGVAYEPHPSIRKYVNRYLLFTNDGYKYIKCKVDEGVTRLGYSVVMFNNRDKVIDMINVDEKKIYNAETDTVNIHQDTSYVAFVLNSVNGELIEHKHLSYYRIGDLIAYMASVAALTFVEFGFILAMIETFCQWWLRISFPLNVGLMSFAVPALLIGGIAGLLAYLNSRSKGIRWTKK